MTAIERTAYPRLKAAPAPQELAELFTPLPEEIRLAQASTRGDGQVLAFLVLLKTFQCLGYFPDLDQVPVRILQHLREWLRLDSSLPCAAPSRSRVRYFALIRAHLGVIDDPRRARSVITAAVQDAALRMDHPADLINAALETLVKEHLEIPAFSTLDRIAGHVRTQVNEELYARVAAQLSEQERQQLDRFLETDPQTGRTPLQRLKELPKSATISHLDEWLSRLTWICSQGDALRLLTPLPPIKIRHLAAEARSLDAAELRDVQVPKRSVMLLALLYQARVSTTDELILMVIKRMGTLHKRGREDLERLRQHQQATQEQMLEALAEIVQASRDISDDTRLGHQIRALLAERGGADKLLDDYEALAAYHGNNYLPLLWRRFKSHRSVFFRLLKSLDIRSTSQDQSVITALQFLLAHEQQHGAYVPATLSLDFTTEQWQRTVQVRRHGQVVYDRRRLEVCIFSQLAAEFKSGDLSVPGSQEFADLREQLVPWEDCAPLVVNYCQAVHLPATGAAFVQELREELTQLARQVDERILSDGHVEISADGEITLKKRPTPEPSGAGKALAEAMQPLLPQRSVLEILKNAYHWTGWTRHFGPLSGSDPKLDDPATRYIILAFGQGCNLGFAQSAKHMRNKVTAHELSFVNRRHVTSELLDRAIVDLVNAYHRCALPKVWGSGKTAAADGTKIEVYRENLFSEYHLRYGGFGGIAYYHISDLYVALFSHFITSGTWEGIYIIDGLLKNRSTIQPDIVHADTQGQSTTVFAMAHLLGIQLMPRIRQWKDLTFYRPEPEARYRHIDHLFGETIDWKLIETHWQDVMQVVLSVKAGKLMPSTILRKLGNYSRKNRLYQVFRELGRAIRTRFLLRYISDQPLREQITAATNKVEQFHEFSQWLRFGDEGVLEENDPLEMEKGVKFNQLVANAIMLSNVLDMSQAIRTLISQGYLVTAQAVGEVSPYIRQHISRYGEYAVDIEEVPPPLDDASFDDRFVEDLLIQQVA